MLGLYIEILVAVEDSSISGLLFFTGIPNGIRHQRSGHITADPVSRHHFSAQIQYGTQIHHSLSCGNIGDIGCPKTIGEWLGKRTLQQIWIFVNGLLIMPIRLAAACL